jgi:hypothetical protein
MDFFTCPSPKFRPALKSARYADPAQHVTWMNSDGVRNYCGLQVYGAMDMGWAKLVGQIAQAYGK